MKPMLIKGLTGTDGSQIKEFEPEIDRQVVRPEVSNQVVEMMVQVVEDGTAKRAKVPGYYVAGKTGTAKKLRTDGSGYSETERIGSFAGLIPAEEPKLAIVVTVDNPTKGLKFGGVVAAPAFAEIALESMKTLGIKPNPELMDPYEFSVQIDQKSTTQIDEMALTLLPQNQALLPDLTGLSYRDAMTTLSNANLTFSFTGSGVVQSQIPPAGTPFQSGDHVEVQLN
jgi:cell division protein FtsI (penicillin-binding protein 3)